jgi:hypothetical protein
LTRDSDDPIRLLTALIRLTAMAVVLTLTSVLSSPAEASYCWYSPDQPVWLVPPCVYGPDWRWNSDWSRLCDRCLGPPFAHVRCFRNLTARQSKLLQFGRY